MSLDTDHLGPRGFLYTDSDLTMFVVIMEDAERSAMCALTNTLDVLKWKEPTTVRHSATAAEWHGVLQRNFSGGIYLAQCSHACMHTCSRSRRRMQLWGKHTFRLLSGWKMCLLGAVCQWELRVDLRDGPKSLSGAGTAPMEKVQWIWNF